MYPNSPSVIFRPPRRPVCRALSRERPRPNEAGPGRAGDVTHGDAWKPVEFLCASPGGSFLLVTLGRGLRVKEKVETVEEGNGSVRGHFLKLPVISSETSGLRQDVEKPELPPPPPRLSSHPVRPLLRTESRCHTRAPERSQQRYSRSSEGRNGLKAGQQRPSDSSQGQLLEGSAAAGGGGCRSQWGVVPHAGDTQ